MKQRMAAAATRVASTRIMPPCVAKLESLLRLLRNAAFRAAGIQTDKLIDRFFVAHAQMALGAEEFFHQKIGNELQVQIDVCKTWVDIAGKRNGRLLKQG